MPEVWKVHLTPSVLLIENKGFNLLPPVRSLAKPKKTLKIFEGYPLTG